MTTTWSLRIGTTGRLAGLPGVLGSLQGAGGEILDAPVLAPLTDLAALAEAPAGERGRLVLDVEALPLEDLGYVRRYLDGAAQPGERTLVLVGDDPGRREARTLLGRDEARFLSWPPDLEELGRLLVPPGTRAGAPANPATGVVANPFAGPTAERPIVPASDPLFASGASASDLAARASASASAGSVDEDELAVIRTILAAPPAESSVPTAAGPDAEAPPETPLRVEDGLGREDDLEDDEDLVAFEVPAAWSTRHVAREDDDDELEDDEDEDDLDERLDRIDEERALEHARKRELDTLEVLSPKAPPPPRYFRKQIADLADIAQSIDLALRTSEADTEPIASDVARLVQFTRTLGYLVAPPPQGHQQFDLGVLLEELVAQLVTRRPNAPRCLFRPEGELGVLSDKQLLTQAFDALLYLASACSDEHDVVRVRAHAETDDEPGIADPFAGGPAEDPATGNGGRAVDEIEFPIGPLQGLDPEQIVEPYSVRDRLPDLGPNALRAAIGILSGQGGSAALSRLAPGRLGWTVELPLAHDAG